MHELQDYVDAQSGGPGEGWFRLVRNSKQARRVIERGKLAVLLGVESSNLFGCSEYMGEPQCDREDVDRGIALYRRLGIRSVFVAHWVNNAFAGAKVESGDIGPFIATFNLQQTGRPFDTGPCPEPEHGEECNTKGLTELGEYLIAQLMENHIMIEADHLSELARLRVLDLAEERDYPIVSSHTGSGGVWTQSDLERLYSVGGFATARPDTAAKLAKLILSFRRFKKKGQPLAIGLGTDTGGFSSTVEPDPAAEEKPLIYPFKSYDGRVSFVCAVTGNAEVRPEQGRRRAVRHVRRPARLHAPAAGRQAGEQAPLQRRRGLPAVLAEGGALALDDPAALARPGGALEHPRVGVDPVRAQMRAVAPQPLVVSPRALAPVDQLHALRLPPRGAAHRARC